VTGLLWPMARACGVERFGASGGGTRLAGRGAWIMPHDAVSMVALAGAGGDPLGLLVDGRGGDRLRGSVGLTRMADVSGVFAGLVGADVQGEAGWSIRGRRWTG
jgi:hypothetical protein